MRQHGIRWPYKRHRSHLAFLQPPVLITRSHDVITLLALTGAGLTTMAFATNLLFNFCISATLAATLTFTGDEANNRSEIATAVAGLTATTSRHSSRASHGLRTSAGTRASC